MNLVQKSEPGLRERKREATTAAIEHGAVDAVEELGYDDTTVDEICRRANISPRTFFNYFPSKDAAIAGLPLTVAGTDGVDEILADTSQPIVIRLASIVELALTPELLHDDLTRRRGQLLKKYPQLHEFHLAGISAYISELSALLTDRLTSHPEERSINSGLAVENEAHLTVELVGTALRYTIRCWVDQPPTDPHAWSDDLKQALDFMSLILRRNS